MASNQAGGTEVRRGAQNDVQNDAGNGRDAESASDDPMRTDAYRFAPDRAGKMVFLSLGGLGLGCIALGLADWGRVWGPGADGMFVGGGLCLIGLNLVLLRLGRHKPVWLTVGPEGLCMVRSMARPVTWDDIAKVTFRKMRTQLQPFGAMLKADLRPGADLSLRVDWWPAGPLLRWVSARQGIGIPIHQLDAPVSQVRASIERFMPVRDET